MCNVLYVLNILNLGHLLLLFTEGLDSGIRGCKSELTIIIISWLVKVTLEMYAICTCLIESLCLFCYLSFESLMYKGARGFNCTNSLCLFFVLGLFCWVLSLVAEGLDSGIRGCKSELTIIISWLAKVTLEIRDVWLCILAHSVLGVLLFCFDFGLVVLRVLTQGLGDVKVS